MLNPQSLYGADVITRMRWAADGKMKVLTGLIRGGMHELIETACEKAEIRPEMIVRIAVVANPCMQQLFLGISTENLTTIPFEPVLRKTECIQAKSIWSDCDQAELWIIPDISGYVGADTVGCIVASKMQEIDKTVLMVDIGTNGEMVLGNKERMAACSTAAGPALEGAKIRFGMRAGQGAIDHVFLKDGKICCSVIGDTKATGICGSGLIDAVAVFLEMEIINTRGRIRNPEELPDYIKEIDGQRVVYLTDKVYITQADIREVQLAKGAIAAGIAMMTEYLGIEYKDISQVFLAGAFGSYIQRASACRIGLLPQELEKKICAVGNAAGKGAGRIVCSRECFNSLDKLLEKVEFLELASISGFQRCFAKCTGF